MKSGVQKRSIRPAALKPGDRLTIEGREMVFVRRARRVCVFCCEGGGTGTLADGDVRRLCVRVGSACQAT